MKVSILIVTKNRKIELDHTLRVLERYIDKSIHEVLVFDDESTDNTSDLIAVFDWVIWEHSNKGLGASLARNRLYKKAKGDIFIGFDDDAHPLSKDFITQAQSVFLENEKIGIIAFQEIRGVFISDEEALTLAESKMDSYPTNDFVGCGFAIRKEVYEKTNGFPVWIDIYGEESCLAIEVLDLNYDIYYDTTIIVNHRVDKNKRLVQGRNYFRFEKQLKNTIYYYVVYYPNPMLKIAKLLFHNLKKYGLYNLTYFKLFWSALFSVIKELRVVLQFRKPVQKSTLQKIKALKGIKY